MATEQCTTEQLDDADMLDSLRYTVRKINIKDILSKHKFNDKFIERSFNITFRGQGSCLDMTENKINYQLNDYDLPEIIDNDFNMKDFLASTKYNWKNIKLN